MSFFASYPVTGGGGGGSIAIGDPVVGGTPGDILYIDVLGNLYGDSFATRDSVTNSTILKSAISPSESTKLDINDDFAASYLGYNNNISHTSAIVGVGDFTPLGFGPFTSLIYYRNNTTSEFSYAASAPTNFTALYQPGTGATSFLGLYSTSFNLEHSNGTQSSGISGSGSTLSINNNNINWAWPTADGTPGQSIVTDGSNVLSFASPSAVLVNGTAPFQWWRWDDDSATQLWRDLWVYTDVTGSNGNTLLGFNTNGMIEGNESGHSFSIVSIGDHALSSIGGGSNNARNTAVGFSAARFLTRGIENVFIGNNSASSRTHQSDNLVVIGSSTSSSNSVNPLTDSIYIGQGVNVSGGGSVHIGTRAAASAQDGIFQTLNVLIGVDVAPSLVANSENVIIGANAGVCLGGGAGGAGNMFLGAFSGLGVGTNPQNCIAIGTNSGFSGAGINGSIALGSSATVTASAQFVVGGSGNQIQDTYIGNGSYNTFPISSTNIHGTDAIPGGTDISGTSLSIYGGQNTGSGTGGTVNIFAATVTGISGNTQNGSTPVAGFKSTGMIVNKTIFNYNGDSTVDNGMPSIVGDVSFTALTAAAPHTTLFTPPITGLYEISCFIEVTSVGISGTITPTIQFNSAGGLQTYNFPSISVASLGISSNPAQLIYATNSNSISAYTTLITVVGVTTYNVFFICKRLK